MYHEHWHHGWGAGHWVPMLVIGVLFWGSLITVIGSLWRRSIRHEDYRPGRGPRPEGPRHGSPPPPHRVSAEEVLAERFARGEIDAEEFRHRLEVLRTHHGVPAPNGGTATPPPPPVG